MACLLLLRCQILCSNSMASVIRFPELLGPQLLVKKAGEAASLLPTSAALHPDAAFVAVLVAAPGWSGNCRNLVRALRTATAAGTTSGALDVVFCSLDHHRRKRAAPHFASMPAAWRALPFGGGGGGGAEEGGATRRRRCARHSASPCCPRWCCSTPEPAPWCRWTPRPTF